MATFEQIQARIDAEIAQAAQQPVFHNAPGAVGVTFNSQDVIVEDGPFHIASKYARVFANDFASEGVPTNDIRIGYETVAATIVGSANGPLNVTANGASAELAILGTDFNDTVNAYNPYAISPGITMFSMYAAIRTNILDENGNQISTDPDNAGFSYWQDELDAGRSLNSIAQAFMTYVPGHDNADNATFVQQVLYTQILGREADAGGLEYCVNYLNNAAANGIGMTEARANLFVSFANSQEYLIAQDIGSRALAWSDANGHVMGPSLDAFLGAGDDIVYATIGNNNIDVGAGNDQVYLSGYNFGVTNISGIQGFETIRFIEDNAAVSINQVTVFNNEDGTATIQMKTNWDATINIFTDGFSADAVARSFGASLPAPGQAAQFNGNWNHFQANALLDFDAEQRIALDTITIVTAPIEGNDQNNDLHGDAQHNPINGYEGDDNLTGNDGNDDLNGGGGNDNHWEGNGNGRVIDYWGQNNIDLGAGNDTAAFGVGSNAWLGQDGKDVAVLNFAAGEAGQRGTVNQFDVGDTLALTGLRADDMIDVRIFEGGNSFDLSAFGKTFTTFASEDVINKLIQNLNGNSIPENEVLELQMKASELQTLFSSSVDNTPRTADIVALDDEGVYNYNQASWTPQPWDYV